MRTLTHIEALSEFATALYKSVHGQRVNNEKPVPTLAKYLGLPIESHRFTRVLTWLIAFYQDAMAALDASTIAERNKSTAKSNLAALFSPFLPPFVSTTLGGWYTSAMSATNQSYFDLLNDVIVQEFPIFLPEGREIAEYRSKLSGLLEQIEDVGLPPWIERDFKESMELTILALEKMPFVAHKIIQDAHSTILARMFSAASLDQKKFMVKVAVTINAILAAFVMPYEAHEAARAYYGWMLESPVEVQRIEAIAAPPALPPPSKKKN